MQVTVESGEGLARQMKVELSPEQIEQEIDKRLRDVARSARLPGFRPGKVPMRVLRQRFGDSVRNEVFGELVKSSFAEAIESQGLRPAGMPQIEADIDQADGRYGYTASFEILPRIELQGIAGKTIKRPLAEVTDVDLERMVERLREQRKTWVAVERAAANGDRITVSYQGTLDGEPFPGSKGEHRQLELGAGRMLPGFEDQLIGAAAGEERVVEVTFPEDYHSRDLAGRSAQFTVQIEEVAEPMVPEVDDEFVRAYGIDDGDLERFRTDVRNNMNRELKQRIEARLKNQVMDALLEANPLDLPAVLVGEEMKALKAQTRQAAGGGSFELPDELFADSAKKRVALGLIIAEAVKRHDLSPDQDRVRARIEEMAATYETPRAVVDYYYSDQQRLASVQSLVLEEMVVERMLEEADVQDEPTSFSALTDSAEAG